MKKAYCTLYESPLVPRLPGDLVPHDAGAARVAAAGAMSPCSVETAHAVWYLPVHISAFPVMVLYSLVWYGIGSLEMEWYGMAMTYWFEMAGKSCTILSSGASPPAESPGRPQPVQVTRSPASTTSPASGRQMGLM